MDGPAWDVVVIGGGMIGAATAYYLAGYGARTLLVERGWLGGEASGRNAGTLNLLNDRTVLYQDLELKVQAMDRWRTLSQELGHDLEVKLDKGTLLVAEHPAEFDRLRALQAGHRAHGIAVEWVEGADLRALAPYLAPDLPAAIFCPVGGLANPRQAAWAYAQAARRRGATVRERTEATAITPDGAAYRVELGAETLHAGKVVLAAGPWSVPLAERLGVHIPLRISYFQASVTTHAPPFLLHGLRRVAGKLTLKQTGRGHCILGGGWQGVSAFPVHGQVSLDVLAQNCAVAARLVPAFARLSVIRTWAGYDGSTTDERPVLDAAPGWPGVIVSTGSSSGFAYGPVLGELTAQRTLGLQPGADIAPFTLARFAPHPAPADA